MLPARLRSTLSALVVLLLLAAPAVHAQAPEAVPLDALSSLPSHSRTGVLYDRVLPLAGLERLDGSAAAPVITAATWRQAWDELRRASLVPGPGPDLAALAADARAALREGVIPLAILDRGFERLAPGSPVADALAGRASLVASRAFAAAALAPRTHRGGDLRFRLDSRAYFSDDRRPRTIEFDFADGLGFRPVALDQPVRVHYATAGTTA